MQDMKVILNIDNVSFDAKPEQKYTITDLVARLKNRNRTKKITMGRLLEAVRRGYSYTPASLKGAKAKDWISQQVFCIDVDNKRDDIQHTSVNDAIEILKANNLPYSFIYYSFSHYKQEYQYRTKFRIVLCCDELITDAETAKQMNINLINLFEQCDKACINLDRFYYGTNQSEVVTSFELFNKDELLALTPVETMPQKTVQRNYIVPSNGFDLVQACKDFDMINYITSSFACTVKNKGGWISVNPCPLSGKNNYFFVNKDRWKCFGNTNHGQGNIINFLIQYGNVEKGEAVEYFKYIILKMDKRAEIKAMHEAHKKGVKA